MEIIGNKIVHEILTYSLSIQEKNPKILSKNKYKTKTDKL